MQTITETIEQAMEHAVKRVKIPPYARFEIRWSTESSDDLGEEQKLDGLLEGTGPLLIGCFDD